MERIGRLNVRMNGRVSLDLLGKSCFRIVPEKGEKLLPLMKQVISGYAG